MLTYPQCTSTNAGLFGLVSGKLFGENSKKTQQPQGNFLHFVVGKRFAEFRLVDLPEFSDGSLAQLLRYGHALNFTRQADGMKTDRFAGKGKPYWLKRPSSTGGQSDSMV